MNGSPQVVVEGAIGNMERLKKFERAARIFCTKQNMDPEYALDTPHPTLKGVTCTQPFWTVIAEKMIDLSLMLTSMREAAEEQASREGLVGHA